MTIIALDPGFGNTKVCIDGTTHITQSAVVHPHNIGLAVETLIDNEQMLPKDNKLWISSL